MLALRRLLGQVISDENLTEAWHKVRTQSSEMAGVDGVSLSQFQRYLFRELKILQRDLEEGRYRAQPAKLIYIAKQDGSQRPIGILTVRDRVAQWAVLNVIAPIFEAEFEETSFGYRPGRSTQMALEHLARLVNQGFPWAVDLDIQNCFESINLARLERLLAHKIKDRRLRKLIHQWLTLERVHVSQRGVVRKEPSHGLLQGSPLSPLLANVYLDKFDKLVRHKGLKTVRYADDIIVLCRTRPEAEKALQTVRKLLISLELDLNPSKTSILHVDEGLRFLGGTLVYCPEEDGNGVWTTAFPERDEEQESEPALAKELAPEDGHSIRR
jgi:group II intron reverse transcriptase/maturase